MMAERFIWSSLGIIAHILISCSSYDNGGLVEECAENEVKFGCKQEGDIVIVKNAWVHQKYYKAPGSSCHIPEYNLQFPAESILHHINKRCGSSYLCSFNLFDDVPGARSNKKFQGGVIQVDYECVFEPTIHKTCGIVIEEQEGWIQNVGYPNYYLGPGACTFTIRVDEGQLVHLRIYDLQIKEIVRPMETGCADELVVTEGEKYLYSKCGKLSHPIHISSQNNILNVTLHSGAEVFLNRGFTIYFKAGGCHTPPDPDGGYLSYRSKKIAEFTCSDEYLFPDTFRNIRTLRCMRKIKWNMSVPNCVHIEDLLSSGNITQNDYLLYNGSLSRHQATNTDLLYVVIIPSTIMCVLVVGNLGILLLIALCRRRNKTQKFEELEEVKNECVAPISTKISE